MTGRVKRRFLEQFGKSPWKVEGAALSSCQEVDRLVERGELLPIDRLFARSQAGERSAALLFLAYLFAATRLGHLCVEVGERGFYPSPQQLGWSESHWVDSLIRGAEEVGEGIDGVVERQGERWYLSRYLRAEELVIKGVEGLFHGKFAWNMTLNLARLLPEQAAVVDHALRHRLTLVCGGPGTGKSFTAAELIRGASSHGKRVAVCAPTGKAVANLRQGLEGLDLVEMKTLHSLLGLHTGWDFGQMPKFIGADLVVVDEASMIDVALFAQLFRALKPGSHLVLMGDPDQLPSVEAGSLFADLVEAFPSSTVCLTRCMRTDLQPIVHLAGAIRRGDSSAVLDLLSRGGVVRLRTVTFPSEVAETIWPLSEGQRILTPLRKGPWGCDQLNRQVGSRLLASHSTGGQLSLPIMVLRNDYTLDLFNGEVGRVVASVHSRSLDELLQDPAALAYFNDCEKAIPAPLLPPCEIAFALSVHKAQGSEFDRVVIAIPPQAEGWGKELLYTAVTRAKKEVEILGSPEELARVVSHSVRRHSGIVSRLARLSLDVKGET